MQQSKQGITIFPNNNNLSIPLPTYSCECVGKYIEICHLWLRNNYHLPNAKEFNRSYMKNLNNMPKSTRNLSKNKNVTQLDKITQFQLLI